MNTLTDFRRHYLKFDRPLRQNYVQSTIPRFYSSFFPSAQTVYFNKGRSLAHSRPHSHYRHLHNIASLKMTINYSIIIILFVIAFLFNK